MKISLKRLGNLLAMFTFGCIAYSIGEGTIQQTIHFAGVANEIAAFCITSVLTFTFGYQVITK